MKKRNLPALLGSCAGMLLLILDSKTAIRGMREGIALCLNSILPALYPFCVLSILITGSITGTRIHLLSPLCRICRIPPGCESLFTVGILGGYPVGAQNVMFACREQNLSQTDANRMAIFCNNAGPAFIFGILGSVFPNPVYLWLLWGIQILSALITGMLIPGGSCREQSLRQSNRTTFTGAIHTAAKGMVSICSCVVLFRMVLEFLSRWFLWLLPTVLQVAVSGILELSNGCLVLSSVENLHSRFILAAGLLSFGGICVWMQTISICSELNLKAYLPWKVVQSIIAAGLASISVLVVRSGFPISMVFLLSALLLPVFTLGLRKKEVAF